MSREMTLYLENGFLCCRHPEEAKSAVEKSLHTSQLQNIDNWDGVFIPGALSTS